MILHNIGPLSCSNETTGEEHRVIVSREISICEENVVDAFFFFFTEQFSSSYAGFFFFWPVWASLRCLSLCDYHH